MTKHKMVPKGHCFFCDDLTEQLIGKRPVCEYCQDKLYHSLQNSHEILCELHDYE